MRTELRIHTLRRVVVPNLKRGEVEWSVAREDLPFIRERSDEIGARHVIDAGERALDGRVCEKKRRRIADLSRGRGTAREAMQKIEMDYARRPGPPAVDVGRAFEQGLRNAPWRKQKRTTQ